MLRNDLKLLALAAAEVLLLAMLVGCEAEPSGQAELSGRLRIAGSSSMERLGDTLAECFMEKYPQVAVTIQYIGSSAGITAVLEGSADIGLSSRELTEDENKIGAVETVMAVDGIVICVDQNNPVSELTKKQLADIYVGRITSWSEVGGEDIPVVVVGREAGSGTRAAFEELLQVQDQCTYANELDGTGAVMARVASTPGAIGYVSFDVRKDQVKVLAMEGVMPASDTVMCGEYTLCRSLFMITRGELEEQGELVRTWYEFVCSEEGRNVAAKAGFLME